MSFRSRLIATLRAIQPVLDEPGTLVVGSEVPNLLELLDAASTLVVSQDVDVAIDVRAHARVKERLREIRDLAPSPDEPSVWAPRPGSELIEVNFLGMSPDEARPGDAFVLEDDVLPLLVFGNLSLLEPGPVHLVEGVRVPLPRVAGLIVEKLVTDRTSDKGDRDLLVVLGLLLTASAADLAEALALVRGLDAELRWTVRSNLAALSLLPPRAGMPDPVMHRDRAAQLLASLEGEDG